MDRNTPTGDIAARKAEHIELVLGGDVEFERSTGLERFEFVHEALPELTLDEIDTTTSFLGRRLSAPLIVSGMTGGTEQAAEINRRIAQAVAAIGLGMGVGSQRISVERPEVADTFKVRELAPEILLIANLGAVQLNYGFTVDHCRRLVESIGADALALHLNPLQEAIQPGGNIDFRGLLGKIAHVCSQLAAPVIVKEVGCGISGATARRLVEAGVAAIDVGGAGGTCWTEIEGRRSTSSTTQATAKTFHEWGIATADAVRSVRAECPRVPLIASGGLRSGLDVAKCLALGADLAAIASPALKAAVASAENVQSLLARVLHDLRLAMFCTGSPRPESLRAAIVRAQRNVDENSSDLPIHDIGRNNP
jgi:isopentenyl-diphosphate delta-isomerase